MGRKISNGKGNADKYILKAFTLFIYDPFGNTVEDRILCARESYKNDKFGTLLLDCVKNFCITNLVSEWNIKSLPNENLINYYLSYGFNKGDKIFDKKGNFKVQKMQMIDFGEENLEEEYVEYNNNLKNY